MSNGVFILFSLDPLINNDAGTSNDIDGRAVQHHAQRIFSLVRVFFSYFLQIKPPTQVLCTSSNFGFVITNKKIRPAKVAFD